jgi:hypothetical protein
VERTGGVVEHKEIKVICLPFEFATSDKKHSPFSAFGQNAELRSDERAAGRRSGTGIFFSRQAQ